MKFTKVQRIEVLLEEIREILQTIKEEEQEATVHSQRTPERYQLEYGHPLAEASSGTNSEAQHNTDKDSGAGSSIAAEQDVPELCVRCLNMWEASVEAGQFELPDCEWEEGRGRKKCQYCSSRRSECVKKIPISIRKAMMRRKAELHRTTADGDIEEIGRKQRRFREVYFVTYCKVKGTISSEERRRRERAALQREEQRKRKIEENWYL